MLPLLLAGLEVDGGWKGKELGHVKGHSCLALRIHRAGIRAEALTRRRERKGFACYGRESGREGPSACLTRRGQA